VRVDAWRVLHNAIRVPECADEMMARGSLAAWLTMMLAAHCNIDSQSQQQQRGASLIEQIGASTATLPGSSAALMTRAPLARLCDVTIALLGAASRSSTPLDATRRRLVVAPLLDAALNAIGCAQAGEPLPHAARIATRLLQLGERCGAAPGAQALRRAAALLLDASARADNDDDAAVAAARSLLAPLARQSQRPCSSLVDTIRRAVSIVANRRFNSIATRASK
jgi:hypothetical protein